MQPQAHKQVLELLADLRRASMRHEIRRMDELTIEIETLTRAYMLPNIDETFFELGLTGLERRLIEVLGTRKGRIVSKAVIMDALYFDKPDGDWPEEKIVDVLVCKMKKKLVGTKHDVENVWGVGYRYKEVMPQ